MNFASDFGGGQDFAFSGDGFCFFPEVICEVPQHRSVFVVLFAFKYFCYTVSAIWWYFVGCFVGFGGFPLKTAYEVWGLFQ